MNHHKKSIAIILVFVALLSNIGCVGKKDSGVFYGEGAFESRVKHYTHTKDEAEKILTEHLTKGNRISDYVYFPYQVIYAYGGGYLFVSGEFKINIQLRGFYVNDAGMVSFVDLKRAVNIKDYRGSRTTDWQKRKLPAKLNRQLAQPQE